MADANPKQPEKDEQKDAQAQSKKAERSAEKPKWLVDPDYSGQLSVDQALKRNEYFASLKAKENK